jgi:hypothetical protein
MSVRTISISGALVLLLALPSAAQSTNPISDSVRQAWNDAKGNLQKSAELMPESDYGFKPTETVRTFGQILAHVAGAYYVFCAAAKGEKSPFSEDGFEKSAKTKADILKAVNDSVAYCDAAYRRSPIGAPRNPSRGPSATARRRVPAP